jgi:glycerophosphoryl diester phosphodiesterase
LNGAWRTLDGSPTRIIAHRGASGVLPEHTLAAFELADAQGADVLEPDLVVTRDARLVVRHDRGLRRSTDIARRAAFESRAIDGDWPVDGFSRAELASLRAIQPFPGRDPAHDGVHPILDFDELIAWAIAQSQADGRKRHLYPELKHPAEFSAHGLDPVPAFIATLRGLPCEAIHCWVQCFEVEPLRRVHEALGLPVFLLVDEAADWRDALRRHRGWLAGFGADKALLQGPEGRGDGIVDAAHSAGLQVHAWTYRDDRVPPGVARVEDELDAAFDLGVDAVFCDFPATALAHRARRVQA